MWIWFSPLFIPVIVILIWQVWRKSINVYSGCELTLLIAAHLYAAYFTSFLYGWIILILIVLSFALSIAGLMISKGYPHKMHAAVLDFIVAIFPLLMVGVFLWIGGRFNGIG